MPDYHWQIYVGGEDLPREFQTGYIVTEGEQLSLEDGVWIVERVEMAEDEESSSRGVLHVVRPHEPL